MFRRTHTELPDRVAQNDGNRVPFGLSVAARRLFASRGVEARRWGLEPPLGSRPRPRPSTPALRPRSGQALRAYAQSKRVERLRAGDFQRANTFERRCGKKQRGIAAVEFAIAVPVLLLLMLASAEVGRWLYQYNTLHKAVRDGVRYLAQEAITGTTGVIAITAAKRTATQNVVVYGNPGGTGNPVLPGLETIKTQIAVTPVDAVHVRVQIGTGTPYNYVPIFVSGIPTFSGGGNIDFNIDMTASATMRAL
jgi:Flp pilus assembly protein TadG